MITAVHFELTRLMYVFSTNHWRCVPQATAKASCSRQGVHFPISEWIQHEGNGNRLPLKGRLEAFFLYLFCCILHFILLLFSFHTQITSRLTMLTWGWHSSTVQFSNRFLVRQYPDAISTPGTCMSYTPSCFWESLTGFPYFKFFSLKMFLASGLSAADQHLHGKQQKSPPHHHHFGMGQVLKYEGIRGKCWHWNK